MLLTLCVSFGACSPVQKKQDFDNQNLNYEENYTGDIPDFLSLKQAVDIAIENNLDTKIAEQDFIVSLSDVDLQKLNALPTITAKRDFLKRNNFAASSSISAETGVQSLEPSISSDRSSRVTALDLNWELVDAAINIYRSGSTKDQSKIAQERYRKVVQNVVLDTHSAFYRLASLQQHEEGVALLLDQSEDKLLALAAARNNGDIRYDQIDKLEKEIFELRKNLLEYQKQTKLSEIELKALLSVDPKQSIRVNYEELEIDPHNHFSHSKPIDTYVRKALKSRPEVREEFLNLRIAQRNLNSEILNTIPGFNVLMAANDDDNSFLEERNWFSLTASLSQSITSLLTLPSRLKKSKEEISLANSRSKALVAAVIFQVNIAYMGVTDAHAELIESRRLFNVLEQSKKRKKIMADNGLVSGLDSFISSAQHQSDKIRLGQKIVEFLLSQQRLQHTVGGFYE